MTDNFILIPDYQIFESAHLARELNQNENSEIDIIINPKEDTIRNIKSTIIIVKREVKDGT
jgi:hypothetical protein